MSRPNRPAAALALTAAVLLAAGCGADGDDTQLSSGSTTTTAPATTTDSATPPTTADTTTTAAPGSTSPPVTGPIELTGDPAVTCEGGGDLFEGDLDGDGTADAILFSRDPAAFTATLEVCSPAWGGGFRLADLGAAESLETVDVDGDGAVELFYGGTTATAKVVQVARLTVDGLVTVATEGGEPLVLTDGYPEGTPPDGPRHTYGCGEAGGSRGLLRAVITLGASAYTAEVTSYRLDGGTAVEAGGTGEGADGPPGSGADLLAQADELADRLAPPC